MEHHRSTLLKLLHQQDLHRAQRFNDFDYGGAACFSGDDHQLQARIDCLKVKIAGMEAMQCEQGIRSRRGSVSDAAVA